MSWALLNVLMGSMFVVLAYQKHIAHDTFWFEIDIFFAVFNFGMMFYNLLRESNKEFSCIDI